MGSPTSATPRLARISLRWLEPRCNRFYSNFFDTYQGQNACTDLFLYRGFSVVYLAAKAGPRVLSCCCAMKLKIVHLPSLKCAQKSSKLRSCLVCSVYRALCEVQLLNPSIIHQLLYDKLVVPRDFVKLTQHPHINIRFLQHAQSRLAAQQRMWS